MSNIPASKSDDLTERAAAGGHVGFLEELTTKFCRCPQRENRVTLAAWNEAVTAIITVTGVSVSRHFSFKGQENLPVEKAFALNERGPSDPQGVS